MVHGNQRGAGAILVAALIALTGGCDRPGGLVVAVDDPAIAEAVTIVAPEAEVLRPESASDPASSRADLYLRLAIGVPPVEEQGVVAVGRAIADDRLFPDAESPSPQVWLDPGNWSAILQTVAAHIGELGPVSVRTAQERLDEYLSGLRETFARLKREIRVDELEWTLVSDRGGIAYLAAGLGMEFRFASPGAADPDAVVADLPNGAPVALLLADEDLASRFQAALAQRDGPVVRGAPILRLDGEMTVAAAIEANLLPLKIYARDADRTRGSNAP